MRGIGAGLAILVVALTGAAASVASGIIELVLTSDPYVAAGEPVTCEVWIEGPACDSGAPYVSGFQAFLGFRTDRLAFVGGDYTDDPFGLHIVPIAADGGELDLAAGINPLQGQDPVCERHLVANLTFTAVVDGEGCNQLFFRAHIPPSRLVDEDGIPQAAELLSTPASVWPVDFDADCDVDADDFAVFALCLNGPGITTPPAGCDPADFAAADLDGDGDVDLVDYGEMQRLAG